MTKTLNDILDMAIHDEILAQKFYRIMSEKAENQGLKKFFISLANEEYGHERILIDIKQRELFDGSVKVTEETLEKIEGAHIIEDPESVDDMTIERGMQIAMKREKKAQQTYGQMADSVTHEEVMKLFIRLAADEQRHYDIINQKYKMYKDPKGFEDPFSS